MKSMTGYGSAICKLGQKRLNIDVRSVNHRYCEINLRAPSKYYVLEPQIVALVKSRIERGKVDINLRDERSEQSRSLSSLDHEQLKIYLKDLQKAKQLLKIDSDLDSGLDLNLLLQLPGVTKAEDDLDLATEWIHIQKSLIKALNQMSQMRKSEGQSLKKVFSQQLKQMSGDIVAIEKILPKNIRDHQKRLEARIKKLLPKDQELDPERLAQELILFTDRCDVTEELDRFKAHLTHFKKLAEQKKPVGRRLDFLMQEFNREVNTLASKVSHAKVSQIAIELKQMIEKIREQIQNVE